MYKNQGWKHVSAESQIFLSRPARFSNPGEGPSADKREEWLSVLPHSAGVDAEEDSKNQKRSAVWVDPVEVKILENDKSVQWSSGQEPSSIDIDPADVDDVLPNVEAIAESDFLNSVVLGISVNQEPDDDEPAGNECPSLVERPDVYP